MSANKYDSFVHVSVVHQLEEEIKELRRYIRNMYELNSRIVEVIGKNDE